MPYSEKLADRIRIALLDKGVLNFEEKKMFRGVTFMVDDKMCISVSADRLMCRVDPELHDQLLEEKPCRTMVMKGREYKGYILVNEDDVSRSSELNFWIDQCLDFNGRAKSSKKRAAPGKKKAGAAGKKKAAPAKKKVISSKKKTVSSKKKDVPKKKRPVKK